MVRIAACVGAFSSLLVAQQLVADLRPGPGSVLVEEVPGNHQRVLSHDGAMFLFLDDGVHGPELWRTDGTAAGTWMVVDLVAGAMGSITQASTMVSFRGRVFFTAFTHATGFSLWSTTGSPGQVTAVHDPAGPADAFVRHMQVQDDLLYFSDHDWSVGAYFVWRSDGTPQGTLPIPAARLWSVWGVSGPVIALPGAVLYEARDVVSAITLRRSDGTAAGTYDLFPGSVEFHARLADRVIALVAVGAGTGRDLWTTDGSSAGTHLLAANLQGAIRITPGRLHTSLPVAVGQDRAWILHLDAASADAITTTDGTVAGTTTTNVPLPRYVYNPSLWSFQDPVANGREFHLLSFRSISPQCDLWRSDGTAAGSVFSGTPAAALASLQRVAFGATLFARGNDGVRGNEPYLSDGSAAGTRLLLDINQVGSSDPRLLGSAGGRVFFLANDGVHGAELWSMPLAQVGSADVEVLGRGCAGSAGVPGLGHLSPPWIGRTSGLQLDRVPPGAPVLFALAADHVRTPLSPHCNLELGTVLASSFALANLAGRASFSLPIPAVPTLVGFEITAQAAAIDVAGTAWPGLSASNGLRLVVGN